MTGFYSCHKTDKTFYIRVYMVLGDAVSTLETFVWILNHVTWSLFTLKASPFHVTSRPSSLRDFRMAYGSSRSSVWWAGETCVDGGVFVINTIRQLAMNIVRLTDRWEWPYSGNY